MLIDIDSLLALMRCYYPPGVDAEDPGYRQTEQAKRLRALMDGMARDMGLVERLAAGLPSVPDEVLELGATVHELRAWPAFMQRLRGEFANCTISNKTLPWYDPCYICEIYLTKVHKDSPRRDAVVGLLSLLAPVYTIYGSHHTVAGDSWTRFPPLPEEFQDHEERLAALIESEFGFTRLANEVLFTPVPELVPYTGHLRLGEAKLIDCLFATEHPNQPLSERPRGSSA